LTQKPKREEAITIRRSMYRTSLWYILIILGMIVITLISYIPRQARLKISMNIQKIMEAM